MFFLPQKTIESETVKTSEVLKKTLGNLSESVKEVNVIGISLRCSLSLDCHMIDMLFQLIHPPLQVVCVYVCGQGLEEVSRTEFGKKIKEGMEEAAKTAKTSAESVSKGGEKLGKTGAFRAISQVWSCMVQICFLFF